MTLNHDACRRGKPVLLPCSFPRPGPGSELRRKAAPDGLGRGSVGCCEREAGLSPGPTHGASLHLPSQALTPSPDPHPPHHPLTECLPGTRPGGPRGPGHTLGTLTHHPQSPEVNSRWKEKGLDLTRLVTTGRTQTQLPDKNCLPFSQLSQKGPAQQRLSNKHAE